MRFQHRQKRTTGMVGLALRLNAPVQKDGTFTAPAEYREALVGAGHKLVGKVKDPKETKDSKEAQEPEKPIEPEDSDAVDLPADDDVEAWQALAKEHGVKSYWLIKDAAKLRARVHEAMGLEAAESGEEEE